MPSLLSTDPNQPGTFTDYTGPLPPVYHPAPRPQTALFGVSVAALALLTLVFARSWTAPSQPTSSHAVPPAPRQPPPQPAVSPGAPLAATRSRSTEPLPVHREMAHTPLLPAVFHPQSASGSHATPALPEARPPAEPEQPAPARPAPTPPGAGLRLVNMRSRRHHLQLPDGRVIRSFDVGRLCDDMLTSRARASRIPAARSGSGMPRLEVEISRCETFQMRGSDLFTARVTLLARWVDAAGQEQGRTGVNGYCTAPAPYDQAIMQAARSAVDGALNLLLDSHAH